MTMKKFPQSIYAREHPQKQGCMLQYAYFATKRSFRNGLGQVKRSRTNEKLTQALQLRVDQILRDCAIRKEDENILAATSRDIVAAEAHYQAF